MNSKNRLKEVATEAEKQQKPVIPMEQRKKIEEYNELKAKVEENGRLVVKGYTDGAKAGLLTKDATDKIEGAMNLTKGLPVNSLTFRTNKKPQQSPPVKR